MRRFLFLLFIFYSLSLISKDWTLMVYIGADNDLCPYVVYDVDEIEEMYSVSGDLDIVLQVDGYAQGSSSGYTDATGSGITSVRRYRLLPDGNNITNAIDEAPIEDLGELNSADPQTIKDFVKWAMETYPADHYMLILWNHGAGWVKGETFKGGLWDDTDGGDFLSNAGGEWRDLLGYIRDSLLNGNKLDALGLDMCVMSYMEILWDVYPYVNILISSEANEPGYGWYYNSFINNLNQYGDTASIESLGKWIVDDYSDFYDGVIDATMTYQIIDDDVVEVLKDAIYNMASSLINNDGGRDNVNVQTCIDNALAMSSGTFYEDFKDLWDFCDQLINNANISTETKNYAQTVEGLIDSLNPYDWEYGFDGSHGLGIYLPDDDNIYSFGIPYNASTHAWNVDCPAWTSFIYGETNFTNIDEYKLPQKENKIKVFNGKIINNNKSNRVKIMDISGRTIEEKILSPYEIYYITGKSGIYFVSINGEIYKTYLIK